MQSRKIGNKERSSWIKVKCLRVVTVSDLEVMFPENDSFSSLEIVKREERYCLYGRKSKRHSSDKKVAYCCYDCNKVYLGPPRKSDDILLRNASSKSMQRGCKVFCRGCGSGLD